MDKMQFLSKLDRNLTKLPFEERQNALRYYMEYFDEAGVENEQNVLAQLGDPKDVAAQIMANSAMKGLEQSAQSGKSTAKTVWLVILAIFAAPIALPLAIVFVVLIIVLFVVLLILFLCGLIIGLAGIVTGIAGIAVVFQSPATTMVFGGMGLLAVGIGILWSLGMLAVIRSVCSGLAHSLKKRQMNRALKNEQVRRGEYK